MFPDKALPEWIKDFQCENWTDICRAKDALRIAWEALEEQSKVTPFGLFVDGWHHSKGCDCRIHDAMSRIRALGDK